MRVSNYHHKKNYQTKQETKKLSPSPKIKEKFKNNKNHQSQLLIIP
jgi:hypothetical protein